MTQVEKQGEGEQRVYKLLNEERRHLIGFMMSSFWVGQTNGFMAGSTLMIAAVGLFKGQPLVAVSAVVFGLALGVWGHIRFLRLVRQMEKNQYGGANPNEREGW